MESVYIKMWAAVDGGGFEVRILRSFISDCFGFQETYIDL